MTFLDKAQAFLNECKGMEQLFLLVQKKYEELRSAASSTARRPQ